MDCLFCQHKHFIWSFSPFYASQIWSLGGARQRRTGETVSREITKSSKCLQSSSKRFRRKIFLFLCNQQMVEVTRGWYLHPPSRHRPLESLSTQCTVCMTRWQKCAWLNLSPAPEAHSYFYSCYYPAVTCHVSPRVTISPPLALCPCWSSHSCDLDPAVWHLGVTGERKLFIFIDVGMLPRCHRRQKEKLYAFYTVL